MKKYDWEDIPLLPMVQIADFLEIDKQTVQVWVEQKILNREARGLIHPQRAARDVAQALTDARSGVVIEDDPRMRKWKADAEIQELKLARMKGDSISVADAAFTIESAIVSARQVLLNLPAVLKQQFPDADPDLLTTILDTVTGALDELSSQPVPPSVDALDDDIESVDPAAEDNTDWLE